MTNSNIGRLRFRLSTLVLLITCSALFIGWLADSFRSKRITASKEEEHQAELLKLTQQHRAETLQLNRKIGRYRKASQVVKSFQVASFRKQAISEEQIRFMSRFPELRKLELSHTNLTSKKLELISELSQLESLNLAHNPELTDESLACLKKMPRLREIELTACEGITATGIRELEQMRALERVRLDRKHRVAAADLIRALPDCVVVFENLHKLESFGILAEFNDRQTIYENTVRRELEDSLDPTNRRRFGSLMQAPIRSSKNVTGKPGSTIDDAEEQSQFLKTSEEFIANPRDESVCKNMLETSHATALRALQDVSAPRRAFYLLARLNQDRANPDLSHELFQLRFSVVKRVAQATFWPHQLPKQLGFASPDSVYFEACEKIEGKTADNVLYVVSSKPMNKISGLCLTHKRMFVFAVERPEFEFAKAFFGDIGRYCYRPNSVQRHDSRSCSADIPKGMELPMIELTKDQNIEWMQNSNRTPIWSVKYLPELGPFGSEHVTSTW